MLGLATELQRAGQPVLLAPLVPPDRPHPFLDSAAALGLPIARLPGGDRRYLRQAAALTAVLRAHEATLVHAHVYVADVISFLATRRSGVPLVATVHGRTGGDAKNRLYEWFDDKLLARRFDAVICVAPNGEARLAAAGCPRSRLHLVPNALVPAPLLTRAEARTRLGLEPAELAIGWIGRLSAEKGADLLLAALREPGTPRVTAVVIGDGPERAALTHSALDLPGGVQVRFAGAQADAATLLPAFDAIAISSRTEGLPMVLLEAMAAEVPVVAFAVGGIPTVLTQASGWVVPPERPDLLNAALAEALTQPAEARRRAALARETLRDSFSGEAWAKRTLAVYEAARSRQVPSQ